MALKSTAVTIATTCPAPIVAGRGAANYPHFVHLRTPASGAIVYIGGADVTTANGFEVLPGEVWSGQLMFGDDLYIVVGSGTQAVEVLEGGG